MAADKDNCQRMKECAAQAEKVARADQANPSFKGQSIVLKRSHYSPKYERCYMVEESSLFAPDGFVSWLLLDAFEGTHLAYAQVGACR